MAVIPRLIARYAAILYVLCTLGAFFYVWTAVQAQRKKSRALFALEREDAATQSRRAWLTAGLCVLLSVGVYSVGAFVVPNLPPAHAEETPVLALLFTPTANPTLPPPPTAAVQASPTPTSGPLPTVAPIATPLDRAPDTPTPDPTLEGQQTPLFAACTSAGTQIVSPSNGDHLSGIVEVLGTANLPEFSFYKFELQRPDSSEWITIESFTAPVAGGVLGYWNTSLLAQQPGNYHFRLVVVDQTGNFPEPCAISVFIDPPGN